MHGLHRAGRQWFEAFDLDSKTKKDLKPIDKNVVISIDPKTGAAEDQTCGDRDWECAHSSKFLLAGSRKEPIIVVETHYITFVVVDSIYHVTL